MQVRAEACEQDEQAGRGRVRVLRGSDVHGDASRPAPEDRSDELHAVRTVYEGLWGGGEAVDK